MATSPYEGSARGAEGDSGKPGRLADPPSKGGIMNTTTPSNSGGGPYVSTGKYAADMCTPGIGPSDHDADDNS